MTTNTNTTRKQIKYSSLSEYISKRRKKFIFFYDREKMPLIQTALSKITENTINIEEDWGSYLIFEDKNSTIIGYLFKDKHNELIKNTKSKETKNTKTRIRKKNKPTISEDDRKENKSQLDYEEEKESIEQQEENQEKIIIDDEYMEDLEDEDYSEDLNSIF